MEIVDVKKRIKQIFANYLPRSRSFNFSEESSNLIEANIFFNTSGLSIQINTDKNKIGQMIFDVRVDEYTQIGSFQFIEDLANMFSLYKDFAKLKYELNRTANVQGVLEGVKRLRVLQKSIEELIKMLNNIVVEVQNKEASKDGA